MGSIPIGAKSYRYRSVTRHLFKYRWNLLGKVQDHHVIPRHLKNHPVIKMVNFDIDSSKNLVMMPNKIGIKSFKNIRQDRLIHGSGHLEYNKYVTKHLDCIETIMDFETLHAFLKHNCRFNMHKIPWN